MVMRLWNIEREGKLKLNRSRIEIEIRNGALVSITPFFIDSLGVALLIPFSILGNSDVH